MAFDTMTCVVCKMTQELIEDLCIACPGAPLTDNPKEEDDDDSSREWNLGSEPD